MNAAQVIFDYIVTFGQPTILLSDNGTQLKVEVF